MLAIRRYYSPQTDVLPNKVRAQFARISSEKILSLLEVNAKKIPPPLSLSQTNCAYRVVRVNLTLLKTQIICFVKPLRLFSTCLLALLLLNACDKCAPPIPGNSFAEVIATGGELAPVVPKNEVVTTDSSESVQNGERWVCVTQE